MDRRPGGFPLPGRPPSGRLKFEFRTAKSRQAARHRIRLPDAAIRRRRGKHGAPSGKGGHHAVGLDTTGKRLFDKALPNDESRLRAVFDQLADPGPLLIVVDQPNTIGALPVTVARACGHDVAYLPGLSMRRIADRYPGQAKTDCGHDIRGVLPAA